MCKLTIEKHIILPSFHPDNFMVLSFELDGNTNVCPHPPGYIEKYMLHVYCTLVGSSRHEQKDAKCKNTREKGRRK